MNQKDRAAMQVALGALESNNTMEKLMAANVLREQLAQPEPKVIRTKPEHWPVGKVRVFKANWIDWSIDYLENDTFLYIAPPKREWVGLTDEEVQTIWKDATGWGDPSHDDEDLVRAIEVKLKEKNT